MISTRQACEMARALEGVSEKDHFGSDAFIANGRIFATVWHDKGEVNLMLTPERQRHYLSIDGEGFAEIDNAWGRQGVTKVQVAFVDPRDFAEALREAWVLSAVKRKPLGSTSARGARTAEKAARRAPGSAKARTAKAGKAGAGKRGSRPATSRTR